MLRLRRSNPVATLSGTLGIGGHGSSGLWSYPIHVLDRGPRKCLPPMDISETESEYEVHVEVPGIPKKNIEVTIDGGVMTVKGKRDQDTESPDQKLHQVERSKSDFMRSVEIPEKVDADKVSANSKDGILIVRLPKTESSRARTIKVKGVDG